MMPFISGFDDLHTGQHYIYAVTMGARVDEEVVAIADDDITFRITQSTASGQPSSVLRKIPRDVVWFIKKFEPERGLESFGQNGYTTDYYRAQMSANSDHGLAASDQLGHERLSISGQLFNCTNYGGTVLARTTHGCIQIVWRKVVADHYPFTLRSMSNGTQAFKLLTIR